MTTTEAPADPVGSPEIGSGIDSIPDFSGENGVFYVGAKCHQRSEDGYFCTRVAGHSPNWNHIASDGVTILAIWDGGIVDPFASLIIDRQVQVGHYITRHTSPAWNDGVHGLRVGHGPEDRCGKGEHGESSVTRRGCTRAKGHPETWACLSTSRDYDHEVFWIRRPPGMTGGPTPVQSIQVVQDPPDGTPEDTAEAMTEKPAVGTVVRLRDRKNLIYVVSHRSNDEIEGLDLTKRELRAIPLSRIVSADAQELSIDELTWVTQWFAESRQRTRDVAVREYLGGRWCMEGLNQQLAVLGLEPYVPQLRGTLNIAVQFVVDDVQSRKSGIEDRVRARMSDPLIAAALRAALPEMDGVELEPGTLAISATNFSRR